MCLLSDKQSKSTCLSLSKKHVDDEAIFKNQFLENVVLTFAKLSK
jgi:hypothetical protein